MIRKIIFVIAFCIFRVSYATTPSVPYSIVFVHAGPSYPTYLLTAIEQALLFNPNGSLYLIGSEDTFALAREKLSSLNVIFVSCESLSPSSQHTTFNERSRLDKHGRSGFWQYATERFFFLEELMQKFSLSHVFHLESDVMLYMDLEEALPIFEQEYGGMGVTLDNDDRVIPGFVYIKNTNPLTAFTHFLVETVAKGDNDMVSLARFRKKTGDSVVQTLPIIPPSYPTQYPLVSTCGYKTSSPNLYTNHYNAFLSIFDGAAIGQYLGGVDPRNAPSSPGFINESALFNPSYFHFIWDYDEKNRLVPFAYLSGEKIKINNLHIHSKFLSKFSSTRDQ